MTLKIGETIKRLRKHQDVTQEKLAEYLNISYQAVSKWENGTALPDITLVPKIANFFGITSDELLGLKPEKNNEELKQFEKEYHELGRKGKVLEKIELSRRVLDLYPRNYQWMLNLAYGLVSYGATTEQQKYRKEHKFIEEAIGLCERVLEDCTVDGIRHSAIQILCYNYPHIGKKEEAIRLAENMPNMFTCKEMLLSRIHSGEDCLKQNQHNMRYMIDHSSSILYEMACRSDLRQGFTVVERIEILQTAIKLNKMMLGDEEKELLCSGKLSLYNLMIAKLYCQINIPGKAIEYLLLAEKSAVDHDSVLDLGEQKYNSILFNHMTWNPRNIITNWDGTLQAQLLYNLDDSCFESLRDKEEFKKLKKRLEEVNLKK